MVDLRLKLKEWAGQSKAHGISNISTGEFIILRIIWTILFLAAMGYLIFSLVRTFQEYFSYDIVTKITNENVNSIDFPAVTFCNKNPFKNLNNSEISNSLKQLRDETLTDAILTEFHTMDVYDYMEYNMRYLVDTQVSNRSSVSYNIDDMLISCRYNDDSCDINDFELYQTILYGYCYTFNSGKNLDGSSEPIKNTNPW